MPDTIEGRFAILATLLALAVVRLDRGDERARRQSVAITERFIGDMDAELREMGVSDPSLGKQVRSLIRSLERRVGLWQTAVDSPTQWDDAVESSLFRSQAPNREAHRHSVAQLRLFWSRLCELGDEALIEGTIS